MSKTIQGKLTEAAQKAISEYMAFPENARVKIDKQVAVELLITRGLEGFKQDRKGKK